MRGTGHGGSAVGFEDGGGHTVREVHGLWEQPPNDRKQGPQSHSCKELSSSITSELREPGASEPRASDEITAHQHLDFSSETSLSRELCQGLTCRAQELLCF